VLDAAGAPITGARIELTVKGNRLAHHDADEAGFYSSGITYSFPPDEHWRAVTGADGRAQLEGLAPRVEIQAEVVKDEKLLRREPDGLTFEPGEKREVEWLIGAGTELRGLVLDQDGKPVEKLEVWAVTAGPGGRRYLMSYESGHVGAKASTGPEGRFVLHDLAAGRWSIGPSGENESLVAPIAELVELAGEPVFDLTLRVSRAIYIRGRVLAPSGEGAPNCWVNGFLTPADRPEGVPTGSDGSFAYGPLGPGTYTLTADAIGRFASSDPVQANAGDKDVVLQLQQGGSIRGRVVDGVTGAATSAQLVFAPEQVISGILVEGMQMTTEPNGSFSVGGLVPGRWSVTASTADGRFAQHAHIEVGAGTDSGELVCALSPGGKLRLGYQGAQPWVHVTVKCQGAAVLLLAGVEAGKFTEYMAPAGALVLEIRGKSAGTVRTKQVELKPGETREIVLTDDD
jgi:protocatechuate 3,4-dioxygenase beta subunit